MKLTELREKTCCFTGHRNIPSENIPSLIQKTAAEVRGLIVNHGVSRFCVGGAIGYDTLAAKILFQLKETEFPNVEIILIYPFDGFIDGWRKEQQNEYKILLPKYDRMICACEQPGREAYLARNRILVDNSAFCVAYCIRGRSGAAYTIRYAKQQGLPVYNLAEGDHHSK